ncbi:MAG: choice-of-anchor D domain-containing protein [Bacteroidales bacterium]|nr:choice-of-anchor D domain-containing protein [Bacteroidales bacterium]
MKKIYLFLILMLAFGLQSKADWTIVASYDIPGKASGLATDGNMLYFGIYGTNGNYVYQFDPVSAQAELLFTSPEIGDSYGMTVKDGSIWIVDRENSSTAYALELSLTGEVLSQIDLPDQYMSGIAAKTDGFWVSTYYPDPGTVYEIDESGNILSQFTPPNNQVWDVCLQDDDLWLADYNANTLYKTTADGTLLESQPCENEKPAGIVFDGTYLWYVDGPLGGNSTLYKVDLSGAGTPAITLPQSVYQYPNTTVGESSSWQMSVFNNGTAPLEINEITFTNGLPVTANVSFPVFIEAGENIEIELEFSPTEYGFFEGVAIISSNDPINPNVEAELSGHGLLDGPALIADFDQVNFGGIRTKASKKQHIILQNYGDEPLTLDAIDLFDENFYLEPTFQIPINISSLGMAEMIVWYFPQTAGDHTATILITNSGSDNPYPILLEGSAQTQSYEIGIPLWSFQVPENYDMSPKAMRFIADISGDGYSDLIVGTEDNIIRALNGNASGTSQILWEREIYSGAVYQQDALAIITDINNDGYEDVVAGTAWGDRSVVALSGKTGQQIWKHSTANYGGGGWVYQVDATTDYNGDEVPDVLAASGNNQDNNGPRRVYCLDGLDGPVIWEAFLGGAGFAVKAIADINGDDIPDALAGCSDADETQGFAKAINGSNGSILWTYPTSGTSVWALAQLDDINEDGVKDVVAGSFNGQLYLLDATNGDLLAQGFAGNNIILRLIPVGDMNDDSFTDFAMAYSGTSLIVYDGKTGAQLYSKSLPDKAWNVERIPDITGDLRDDLATGTLYQSNYAGFYDGVDGAELFSTAFGQAIDALTVLPDITEDNSWEMVAGGRNGKIVCYSGGLNAPVGKQEIYKFGALVLYPNPAKEFTLIEIPEGIQEDKLNLKLNDLSGRLILSRTINSGVNNFYQLNLEKIPSGIYLIELGTTNQCWIQKLIVE